MKLNCLILTTSKDHWMAEDVERVREWLLRTPGRESVDFTIKTIKSPKSVTTAKNSDGKALPSWDWFSKTIRKEASPEYNAVGFHFSKTERRKWRIAPSVNGLYYHSPDDVLDFWLCANEKEKAKHYPYSQFARVLVHELLHGDVHWTNDDRDLVHRWDYEYKDIHSLVELVSYKDWNILTKIRKLLSDFLKKV